MDKNRQRRIWQRVLPQQKAAPQPRQALEQCRRRAMESLRFYERRTADPVYGPAYDHLVWLCRQQIAMLDGITGRASR